MASKIVYNENLQKLNTFKVEASAEAFLAINSIDELEILFSEISKYNEKLVIGGGSNLLFAGDYSGLVIYPQLFGIEKTNETQDNIYLRVAASENWHDFVTACLKNNYFGIENLALIPGTVGAAPVQNIGAYGVEIERFIESVECFDLQENEHIIFNHSECEFAYRESRLKNAGQGRYLVCYVNFILNKIATPVLSYAPLKKLSEDLARNQKEATPKNVYDWVCKLRKEKLPDPFVLANAGSFFKNPTVSSDKFVKLKNQFPNIVGYPDKSDEKIKVAAGWLIDNAGLKGKRVGNVAIHEQQALVLVNFGEMQGSKILDLACDVMQKIKSLYGIVLEPEVRVLGIDLAERSKLIK
ncbi:MAG: UDP-N-acetylenolpyruvoylglucosamine reductase [Kangiella sp.]|nr:MAG: UDP-N-acetylenolpyruvoylglucosamine reductase [Kangiella sp.]